MNTRVKRWTAHQEGGIRQELFSHNCLEVGRADSANVVKVSLLKCSTIEHSVNTKPEPQRMIAHDRTDGLLAQSCIIKEGVLLETQPVRLDLLLDLHMFQGQVAADVSTRGCKTSLNEAGTAHNTEQENVKKLAIVAA